MANVAAGSQPQSEFVAGSGAGCRALVVFFYVAVAVFAVVILGMVCAGWRNGLDLTPTSGTWIALADDLKHGMFYRPMFSDLGYGGTRYFPLHFVLHAAIMKMGLGAEAAGHTLEALTGLALLFGIYRVLRALRIAPLTAICVSVLVLAPQATRIAILSIRGDLLPTTFIILGLSICMALKVERRHVLLASICFILAFATKPTSLYGAGAVLLAFLIARQFRNAAYLLAATALGCAAVLGITSVASGGRFFAVLKACAVTAGYNLPTGLSHFVNIPALESPIELVFLVLGFAACIALLATRGLSMPAIFFACTAVSTAIVLGADGTNLNHFIDIDVACLIVFAAWLFDERTQQKAFGIAVMVLISLFASCATFWSIRHTQGGGYFDFAYSPGMREAVQFIGRQDKPILAEHPLLPILAGQRPYLLDDWMFKAVSEKNPQFEKPMADAIRQQQFSAIVLEFNLGPKTQGEVADSIRQNYQLAQQFPRAWIFLPKSAAAQGNINAVPQP